MTGQAMEFEGAKDAPPTVWGMVRRAAAAIESSGQVRNVLLAVVINVFAVGHLLANPPSCLSLLVMPLG